MLAGTNLSIDPGTLLPDQHQQLPLLFEADTASSRTTSTSSVSRLSTPDTETDDDDITEKEDNTLRKPNTRSKTKLPATSTRSKPCTSSSSTKSKRRATAATGAADKRRKRNLERNRAAASKCRQRKKQWQDGLERRRMELESRYKALHGEVKDLIEEVAQLKNFVMSHAGCNDANIDDWIRNEADNFVRRIRSAQMQQAIPPPPGSQAVESMSQMQSLTQSALTATPLMNDTLNNMFAPPGSKAPFDTAIADTSDQTNIFDQDLLMVSGIQT